MIKIPIGRVNETFQLLVCIHALYIAAIQKMWMENCTAVKGNQELKVHRISTYAFRYMYITLERDKESVVMFNITKHGIHTSLFI